MGCVTASTAQRPLSVEQSSIVCISRSTLTIRSRGRNPHEDLLVATARRSCRKKTMTFDTISDHVACHVPKNNCAGASRPSMATAAGPRGRLLPKPAGDAARTCATRHGHHGYLHRAATRAYAHGKQARRLAPAGEVPRSCCPLATAISNGQTMDLKGGKSCGTWVTWVTISVMWEECLDMTREVSTFIIVL